MQNQITLVALDIDGTLLPAFHDPLSPRLREALVRSVGELDLALITGRSYEEVQPVLAQLSFPKIWLGLGGGGEIRSPDGEVIFQAELEMDDVRSVVEFAHGEGVVHALGEQGWQELSELPPASPIRALFVGPCTPQRAAALQALGAQKFPHLYVSVVTDPTIDGARTVFFQPGDATKGDALRRIQQELGATKRETAAAGDMSLDVPMFEHACLSAAMGNAPEEVKARARTILGSVDEEGVAELLEGILDRK